MAARGSRPDSDLDQALEKFQERDLEWGAGLANHGPMAAEALCALGHPALLEGLVDVYAPRLSPLRVGAPIAVGDRTVALGDPARLPDWVATFERACATGPWRELLADELPPLLAGLFAGAGHGLLRVAHAARALEQEETPIRRRELAFGLAYWAGRYQELPGLPSQARQQGFGVAAAVAAAPTVPIEARRPGLFFEAVGVLSQDPFVAPFRSAVERFDAGSDDLSQGIRRLCLEGARLYLANPGARIAYVHCVTVPSALRLLAPYLPVGAASRALGHALQALLALHGVSAQAVTELGAKPVDAEVERLARDTAEIRYRAACSVDEHAIKLAEACLREHAIAADDVFLRAAADAAIHLDAGAGRGARC
jgi:hypothetical protein